MAKEQHKTFKPEVIRTMAKDMASVQDGHKGAVAQLDATPAQMASEDKELLEKLQQRWKEKRLKKHTSKEEQIARILKRELGAKAAGTQSTADIVIEKPAAAGSATLSKPVSPKSGIEEAQKPSTPAKKPADETHRLTAQQKQERLVAEIRRQIEAEKAKQQQAGTPSKSAAQKTIKKAAAPPKTLAQPPEKQQPPPKKKDASHIAADPEVASRAAEHISTRRQAAKEQVELQKLTRKKTRAEKSLSLLAEKRAPLETEKQDFLDKVEAAATEVEKVIAREEKLQAQKDEAEAVEAAATSNTERKKAETKRWEVEQKLHATADLRWKREEKKLQLENRVEQLEQKQYELQEKESDLEIQLETIAHREKEIAASQKRRDLEKEIEQLKLREKPLQKQRAAVERDKAPIADRLQEIVSRERAAETAIRTIEQQIAAAVDVKEKRDFEGKLWVAGERRQAIEKERHRVEADVEVFDKELRKLDKEQEHITTREESLRNVMHGIELELGIITPSPAKNEKAPVDTVATKKTWQEERTAFVENLSKQREAATQKKAAATEHAPQPEKEETLMQEAARKAAIKEATPTEAPATQPVAAQQSQVKTPAAAPPPQPDPTPETVTKTGGAAASVLAKLKGQKQQAQKATKERPHIAELEQRHKERVQKEQTEREQMKQQRIEDLKKRLREAQKVEEERRDKFVDRVEKPAEQFKRIPEVEQPTERDELIIRTVGGKPSTGGKLITRIIVMAAVLVVLGGIIGFWYWLLVVRPNQPAPVIAPPPPPQEEIVQPTNPPQAPLSIVSTNKTDTIRVESAARFPTHLTAALRAEDDTAPLTRLLFLDDELNEFYTLEEFLQASAVETPTGFFDRIDANSYTVTHHYLGSRATNELKKHHLGFVTTITNQAGIFDFMRDWEATMEQDTDPLFSLLGKQNPATQTRFGQFNYRDTVVRCLPFEVRQDFGICWALSGNTIVFASSGATAQTLIDNL